MFFKEKDPRKILSDSKWKQVWLSVTHPEGAARRRALYDHAFDALGVANARSSENAEKARSMLHGVKIDHEPIIDYGSRSRLGYIFALSALQDAMVLTGQNLDTRAGRAGIYVRRPSREELRQVFFE
jgi:hypothetical protein